MTATEELRRLLDERGIEHVDFNMPDKFLTMFGDGEHDGAYTENSVDMILTVYGASPEQAIDATLGRGTCRNVGYYIDGTRFKCSACGYNGWVNWASDGMDRVPHYCPSCGAEVTAGAKDDG